MKFAALAIMAVFVFASASVFADDTNMNNGAANTAAPTAQNQEQAPAKTKKAKKHAHAKKHKKNAEQTNQ